MRKRGRRRRRLGGGLINLSTIRPRFSGIHKSGTNITPFPFFVVPRYLSLSVAVDALV